MSKTDKTAPMRAKVCLDPSYLVEDHDHTDPALPCDLPPRPIGQRAQAGGYGWDPHTRARCTWDISPAFWHDPIARCGCFGCRGLDAFDRPARRDRRSAKKQTRTWARGAWREEF